MSYFSIINLDRYDGCYGQMIVPFLSAYIEGQGTLPVEELEAWAQEQTELNARGEHFFASGRFSFHVSKQG